MKLGRTLSGHGVDIVTRTRVISLKNLPVEEFERVQQRYSRIYDDYSRCVKTVEYYLRPSSPRSSRSSLKSSNVEPTFSPITSSKSKSSRSSRSSKLREMKRNVELKKLMAKQPLELARYEAEMEKRKLISKCKRRKLPEK